MLRKKLERKEFRFFYYLDSLGALAMLILLFLFLHACYIVRLILGQSVFLSLHNSILILRSADQQNVYLSVCSLLHHNLQSKTS